MWVSTTYEKETPLFNSFETVIVKILRSTAQIAIVHAVLTMNLSSNNLTCLGNNILRSSRWRYEFLRFYYSTISSRSSLKRTIIAASMKKNINVLKDWTSNWFVGLKNISQSHWIPSLLLGLTYIRDIWVEYVIVHNALIKNTRSWLWSWTAMEDVSVSLILIRCIESIHSMIIRFITEHLFEHVLHTRQGALLLSWLNKVILVTGPTPIVIHLIVHSGH